MTLVSTRSKNPKCRFKSKKVSKYIFMIPMSNKRVETTNICARRSLSRKKLSGTITNELRLILIMFSDTQVATNTFPPMALHIQVLLFFSHKEELKTGPIRQDDRFYASREHIYSWFGSVCPLLGPTIPRLSPHGFSP